MYHFLLPCAVFLMLASFFAALRGVFTCCLHFRRPARCFQVLALFFVALRARWREQPRVSRAPRARNRKNAVPATVLVAMRARWRVPATVFAAMRARWREKPRVSTLGIPDKQPSNIGNGCRV